MVYVHEHVDNIVIGPVSPPAPACVSKNDTLDLKAAAFSRGNDITSSVGTFSWSILDSNVATISTTASGLLPGQIEATAKTPGRTTLFARISNVTSSPLTFETCLVKSITLQVNGAPPADTSFSMATGGSKTITATVTDSANTEISGVPLTWSSSETAVATVSDGTVSGVKPGGASIIGSCTPPTCNIGVQPPVPVYPDKAIAAIITGTRPSTTVLVSTTDCGTNDDCVTRVLPITTQGNTVGDSVDLPITPNSLLFGPSSKAFMGTNSSLLGSKGLTVLEIGGTLTHVPAVAGKVLAVSPNGNKVVIANTTDSPNQVFIFDTTNNSNVALPITGASAAAFSPDNFKAYIVAGNTVYIYSALTPLQSVSLGAAASDLTFLASGAFAYFARGSSATEAAVRSTCNNSPAGTVNTSAPFIQSIPDGTQLLALNVPNMQVIRPSVASPDVCPPTVDNSQIDTINLGAGSFNPQQLLVSTDESKAYIVAADLSSVLVFDIRNQTTSAIALAGGALPVQATLTSDGGLLYVAANDGLVHVLDTLTGLDVQQIDFPQGLCSSASGDNTFTCKPNLVAARR
jgi:hypothetical protein